MSTAGSYQREDCEPTRRCWSADFELRPRSEDLLLRRSPAGGTLTAVTTSERLTDICCAGRRLRLQRFPTAPVLQPAVHLLGLPDIRSLGSGLALTDLLKNNLLQVISESCHDSSLKTSIDQNLFSGLQ